MVTNLGQPDVAAADLVDSGAVPDADLEPGLVPGPVQGLAAVAVVELAVALAPGLAVVLAAGLAPELAAERASELAPELAAELAVLAPAVADPSVVAVVRPSHLTRPVDPVGVVLAVNCCRVLVLLAAVPSPVLGPNGH